MLSNKDIRVDNGNLVLNGDKYPLDGQSPEAIMQIVEDNSDSTPTENSTAPITSGGVFTALAGKEDTLTFDTTPTDESTNPVTSGGIYNTIGDLTQTGITGADVAAQLGKLAASSVDRIAGVSSFDIVLSDVTYTAAIFGTISTTPISCIITAVADAQNPLAITKLGTDITTEATVTFNEATRTVTITSTSTKKFYVNVYK